MRINQHDDIDEQNDRKNFNLQVTIYHDVFF
jgi:hypothetical protein